MSKEWLNESEVEIIESLSDQKKPVKQIRNDTNISESHIISILGLLKNQDIVQISNANNEDRRYTYYQLTDLGVRISVKIEVLKNLLSELGTLRESEKNN